MRNFLESKHLHCVVFFFSFKQQDIIILGSGGTESISKIAGLIGLLFVKSPSVEPLKITNILKL